jgi:hypothetical protein
MSIVVPHVICPRNGWAAAGMMYVLSAMNHTSDALPFSNYQANVTKWINEILKESWSHQVCIVDGIGIGHLLILLVLLAS